MSPRFLTLVYVVSFVAARVLERLLGHRRARGHDTGAVIEDRVNWGESGWSCASTWRAQGGVVPRLDKKP